MVETDILLENCLYFTANALARAVTRMAETAFMPTGLSPSQAFLLMLVIEQPGATPSDLAARLRLAPSTVTRLVDSLKQNGLVEKQGQGKTVHIHPTDSGRALSDPIAKAWKTLYYQYSDRLGEAAGKDLTATIHAASLKLD